MGKKGVIRERGGATFAGTASSAATYGYGGGARLRLSHKLCIQTIHIIHTDYTYIIVIPVGHVNTVDR